MVDTPEGKMPVTVAQNSDGEWYNYSGRVDACGLVDICHVDVEAPYNSHSWKVNHDGSFETNEISDQYDGMTTKSLNHARENAASSSENVDGNADRSFQASLNQNTFGDMCTAAAGKHYKGSDTEIGGATNGSTSAPQGKSYTLCSDNVVMDLKKDRFVSIEGRDVTSVEGVYFVASASSIGFHAQGKGIDLQSETQAQVRATQKINVQSDTEIQLKINGCVIDITTSTIKLSIPGASIFLSPGSIALNAPSVTVNGSALKIA